MDDELIKVTQMLGMDYDDWKDAEKLKNHTKDEFFRLATEAAMERTAAQVVLSYAKDDKELHEEMARKFPAWYITEYKQVDDHYEVYLKENPELAKFSFVNPNDGKVYSRQIVTGVMMLDDDRLKEENPQLWEQVTFVPEPERQLRPIDELSHEQVQALQQYTYMTKPTVKLGAPRKATEEELAETNGESAEKEEVQVSQAPSGVR